MTEIDRSAPCNNAALADIFERSVLPNSSRNEVRSQPRLLQGCLGVRAFPHLTPIVPASIGPTSNVASRILYARSTSFASYTLCPIELTWISPSPLILPSPKTTIAGNAGTKRQTKHVGRKMDYLPSFEEEFHNTTNSRALRKRHSWGVPGSATNRIDDYT